MVNSGAENQSSGKKLFYGLFIFPLLIAVGMAVLLCTVVLLTREVETPETLVAAIKSGSSSKRWQKAFELSNELNQGRGLLRSAGLMNEIIHILNDRSEYDAQTRSYMAIALSRFPDPAAVSALEKTLKTESDPEVQLYLIWALGVQKSKSSIDLVVPYLKSEQEELRKVSVYVLGVIGTNQQAALIEPLLEDTSKDVRWNAALSLARLGNSSGYSVLVSMIDREALRTQAGLTEERIEEVMVNAIKGIGYLKTPDLKDELQGLADKDSSLKVRQTALEILKTLK